MEVSENKKLAKELKSSLNQLIQKRSTWEEHWQSVSDYFLTRKSDVNTQRTRGDKRNIQIFDSSAVHSLELLASSLHGMLTSSANRWFALRFKEADINSDDSAREWLEDATDKMYLAFARSNFQQEIFESYHDLICFGTSCLYIKKILKILFGFHQDILKKFIFPKMQEEWLIASIDDLRLLRKRQ